MKEEQFKENKYIEDRVNNQNKRNKEQHYRTKNSTHSVTLFKEIDTIYRLTKIVITTNKKIIRCIKKM